jgi:hypothetical protein
MLERRTLKRIELNQLALVHVAGVRGFHPCMVLNLHRDFAITSPSASVCVNRRKRLPDALGRSSAGGRRTGGERN